MAEKIMELEETIERLQLELAYGSLSHDERTDVVRELRKAKAELQKELAQTEVVSA